MIDFKKYGGGGRGTTLDPSDLLKLFESLDRRTTHTELRPAQIEALRALSESRAQRDHVLKVSTGAGKTTVGLLYLRSHAIEKGAPVVYLCPTAQLVGQVVAEAKALGLAAVDYPGGQPHPEAAGMTGEAIIVCTYKKLFVANTTFDRVDVQLSPCALVLDDAHAGIEEVRDSFSMRLPATSPVAQELTALLEAPLKSFAPGPWSGVLQRDYAAIVDAPYWIWQPLVDQVRQILAAHADEKELRFVWGHLRDRLELCRCLVNGTGIEITCDVPAVEDVRGFAAAAHRLFTSATLADDSALVRELGCESAAVLGPIEPKSDAGVGERMVLAPSLIDPSLDRKFVQRWAAQIATRESVVVLTSSNSAAEEWQAMGATVTSGGDITPTVEALRTGVTKFVAFANRYDGVDLPDDACRVLIIDGMPSGESLASRHDALVPGRPSASQNRIVHRIEQGMGRAVRSHVDYAVVIFCGPELASFVSRTAMLALFNSATRVQIQLAPTLAEIANAEAPGGGDPGIAFTQLVASCIRRDPSWKEFYDREVRSVAKVRRAPESALVELAVAEREAAKKGLTDPAAAATLIEEEARKHSAADPIRHGWFLQTAAAYRHAVDPAAALQLQVSAHEKNPRMFPPPKGARKRPVAATRVETSAAVIKWFDGFLNPNGAIAYMQALRARLSFGTSAEVFEQAVMDLAEPIGARGFRPERDDDEGPDDLWLWDSVALVIECKNEEKSPDLPKRDSGQLHDSMEWFRRSYPTRTAVPVVFARSTTEHDKAHFPEGTVVVTPDSLGNLLDAVEKFVAGLATRPIVQWTAVQVGQLAVEHGVSPAQFVGRYTSPLR